MECITTVISAARCSEFHRTIRRKTNEKINEKKVKYVRIAFVIAKPTDIKNKYRLRYNLSWRNALGEASNEKPQPPVYFNAINDDSARDQAREHIAGRNAKWERQRKKSVEDEKYDLSDGTVWRYGIPKFSNIRLERLR
jgi:hypothetical protein